MAAINGAQQDGREDFWFGFERTMRHWAIADEEHAGSTTLPEVLPHASPDQLPHDWHLELRCPHWLEQGHLNWEWPNYVCSDGGDEIVSRQIQKVSMPGRSRCRVPETGAE